MNFCALDRWAQSFKSLLISKLEMMSILCILQRNMHLYYQSMRQHRQFLRIHNNPVFIQAAALFLNWTAVLITMLCAQSWGLMIGAGVSNLKHATTVGVVVMLLFLLGAGFITKTIPTWMRWTR